MKKTFHLLFLLLAVSASAFSQRHNDVLTRGLVVVPTGSTSGSKTNLVGWRRFAEEYYDVTYNLYKDGTKIASNLQTTSYDDTSNALPTSRYQVAAVVGGVEKEKCDVATAWSQYVYKNTERCPTGFIDIALASVYNRDGNDVTSHYEPNDAEFADLDGDGELEMIIKRLNTVDVTGVNTGSKDDKGNDIYNIYPQNSKEFVVLDAYDINWQTGEAQLMWRIDCGPNMVSANSTEINIIAFDWDGDGRAEVVLRGADNMIVYGSDGKTQLYTIGNMTVNTRPVWYSQRQDGANIASLAFTNTGAEYLIYMDGETGAKYQVTDYPLTRGNASDWGDTSGHRSSKYFFGAPYLDGSTPSLFLGRGIYTKHKMMAMDLSGHTWIPRWTWNCDTEGSPWFGNGYHNFIIADVDEDGRDEIVYGSMVIDDNGNGLSTTGLGHGDAQHVGDFDPWRKGLEFFGCNEDNPGMNYRNATTSEIYIRRTAAEDDGRALMANFSNDYPGSLGRSVSTSMLSSVVDKEVGELSDLIAWNDLNFRIYWDGDLCSEVLNSPGTAREAKIDKPGKGRLFTSSGCNMNNDSKNNPCFQGDLIGDWREEIVVRCGQNVRIYTSGMSTSYSLPTLWHDHQYRQAMVWQMMAYNQPPHLSYFLGELEGITMAPPPLTTDGRTTIGSGTNISSSFDGQHLLHNEYANTSLSMGGGVPSILTINVPAWVQGNDNNDNITTTIYTCNLAGGAMSGTTRLVKQGNGILSMGNAVHTNTGETNIWGGTVNFDGTMQGSPVWMNRHTTLNTTGGTFNAGLAMDYGATLNIGGEATGNASKVDVSELTLNFGSRVVLDVDGQDDADHDWLNAQTLNIDDSKCDQSVWMNYGPKYIAPVFELRMQSLLGNGRYPIGNVETVTGDLSKVVLENNLIDASHLSLIHEDGVLYLQVDGVATANEADVEIIGMANYSDIASLYPSASADTYFLPTVGISGTATAGTSPVLSGTFTSLDGTVTNIGSEEEKVLFSKNYESATDATDWVTLYATMEFKTDNTKYVQVTQGGGTGPRSAYNRFYSGNSIYQANAYTVEFDAATHPAQGNYNSENQIILFGEGAAMPSSNQLFGSTNYVFKLSGGSNYGTTYAVEGSGQSFTLADGAWYHYAVSIDKTTRKVSYTITKGTTTVGNGQYTIGDESVNMSVQGMFIGLGRANSYTKIDNIAIKSPGDDLSTYTFSEPGTLRVKASVEGYASSVKTFTANYPYIKTGTSGNISADYLPVCIHDEQATSLPLAVSDGNAHLYRSALTTSQTWASMVLPFDVPAAQVKEVFGENVTVANLEVDKGDATKLYFEKSSGAIHANQPFLIKDVTNAAPYLITGISSEPTDEPTIASADFAFIGTYVNKGQTPFTLQDYFFQTDGLKRVSADGVKMTLKGYRGWFHLLQSAGTAKVSVVFETPETTALERIATSEEAALNANVYTLAGQLIRRNATDLRGLKPGVYLVGNKRVVVK